MVEGDTEIHIAVGKLTVEKDRGVEHREIDRSEEVVLRNLANIPRQEDNNTLEEVENMNMRLESTGYSPVLAQ